MSAGSLAAAVEAVWRRDTVGRRLAAAGLAPLAAAYGAAIGVRNRLYDAGVLGVTRVPAWVVGVGNLTVGGTGKTPTALWLAERLRGRGRRVALVGRGYGKRLRGVVVVGADGRALVSPDDGGDEAVLAAERIAAAVVTGEDRAAAADLACTRFACDTIVLDDGFQHRALGRDADLVLLPADGMPRGLLPAGPLREPAAALRRARAVLALGDERRLPGSPSAPPGVEAFVGRLVPSATVVAADGRLVAHDLQILPRRQVVAVAGVARPERFWALLDRLGVGVVERLRFPDHHRYDAQTLAKIRRAVGPTGRAIVTTEKDLVKLAPALGAESLRLHAVRIEPDIADGDALIDCLTTARD